MLEVRNEGRLRVLRLEPSRTQERARPRADRRAPPQPSAMRQPTTTCGRSCSPGTATPSAPGSTSASPAMPGTLPRAATQRPAARLTGRSHLTVAHAGRVREADPGRGERCRGRCRRVARDERRHPHRRPVGAVPPGIHADRTLSRPGPHVDASRGPSDTSGRCASCSSSAWCRRAKRSISAWSARSSSATRISRIVSSSTARCSRASRRSRRVRPSSSCVRAEQPADLVAHLDAEIELVMQGARSQDSAEAIRAMQARETPDFRGR